MDSPPAVKRTADTPVTRRTWMEWVGKATVLSLGSVLLTRCNRGMNTPSSTGDPVETENLCGSASLGEKAFTPASFEGTIFENWPVRTVDPQELNWILSNWQLTVDGMVDEPGVFTFTDLFKLPRQDQITDFHCVEGWSIPDVPWNGVHLSELLALVKPHSSATHITFHTINETYNESLPLEVALEPRTLLAYGINCATLPLDHGFPLRLVVPRLLAYKSPKYVYRIELTDKAVSGFWVQRGYSYEGEVSASRLRPGKY